MSRTHHASRDNRRTERAWRRYQRTLTDNIRYAQANGMTERADALKALSVPHADALKASER